MSNKTANGWLKIYQSVIAKCARLANHTLDFGVYGLHVMIHDKTFDVNFWSGSVASMMKAIDKMYHLAYEPVGVTFSNGKFCPFPAHASGCNDALWTWMMIKLDDLDPVLVDKDCYVGAIELREVWFAVRVEFGNQVAVVPFGTKTTLTRLIHVIRDLLKEKHQFKLTKLELEQATCEVTSLGIRCSDSNLLDTSMLDVVRQHSTCVFKAHGIAVHEAKKSAVKVMLDFDDPNKTAIHLSFVNAPSTWQLIKACQTSLGNDKVALYWPEGERYVDWIETRDSNALFRQHALRLTVHERQRSECMNRQTYIIKGKRVSVTDASTTLACQLAPVGSCYGKGDDVHRLVLAHLTPHQCGWYSGMQIWLPEPTEHTSLDEIEFETQADADLMERLQEINDHMELDDTLICSPRQALMDALYAAMHIRSIQGAIACGRIRSNTMNLDSWITYPYVDAWGEIPWGNMVIPKAVAARKTGSTSIRSIKKTESASIRQAYRSRKRKQASSAKGTKRRRRA